MRTVLVYVNTAAQVGELEGRDFVMQASGCRAHSIATPLDRCQASGASPQKPIK